MNKPKLWTKDFLIVVLVHFFIALNFYLLMVIVSVFAMDSFQSSPSEAGLAASIFVIGTSIARLFSGRWIERTGRKRMLYSGLILSLAMTLSYFGINGIVTLLVVRLLHGVAFGMAHTATGTIVANIIPQERTGEGIGYYMLAATLATAIGPFLGMFISQYGNFAMVFIACAISAALALACAMFLSVREIALTEEQLETIGGFNLKSFFEPKVIPISIVCGVIYLCYSSVLAFLAVYSREIHLVEAASFFFIMYAISVLLSRPYIGRLVDSAGENSTMYPSIIIFTAGMVVLAQAHHGYVLLVAGILIGVGSGAVQSISQAVSVKVTPPHRMGLATSTFWIFNDVGIGVGPFILGLLIPLTGYRGLYMCMGIVAFACTFLYYILHGKRAGVER